METTTFNSSYHQHPLHVCVWPVAKPKAVFQIITGMTEYIERYSTFAEHLNELDILVFGHDFLGQGQSAIPGESLGYFGEEPLQTTLTDSLAIGRHFQAAYPELPFFVMGHSMGSMLLTQYLKHPNRPQLAGAVEMGVIHLPSGLKYIVPMINQLNKINPKKTGHFWQKVAFGSYSRQFVPSRPSSWISHNLENVTAFENSPYCNYIFSRNGFSMLFELAVKSHETDWISGLDDLPVLVICGQDDPSGGRGKRAEKLTKQFEAFDVKNFQIECLPDMSHEILNEKDYMITQNKISNWVLNYL